MQSQVYTFIAFILNGFLIGLIFDIFRILRKTFKTSNLLTQLQDITFWILTGILLLYSIFKFNNGEIRVYIFIGILLGVTIYLLVFSKLFIKVNVAIINYIKKIIFFIFIKPIIFIIKMIKKILLKPISFIFINFKKSIWNIVFKFKQKFNKKKDLA